ncbi:MAG: alpha-L-glutamate ligase-like protein [Nitrospirales bacterium]|nr:alpha-L-glutamate ligase-like protein [Nitrospirales bacterium]
MTILKAYSQLSELGILGLNHRNAVYTLGFNERRFYPLVDDKVRTKSLCSEAGVAVPALYGTIEIERQVRDLPHIVAEQTEFVIKPAHGSGGDGIIVIKGQVKDKYRKANGVMISLEDLQHHISNVLSGMYSLGGATDTALIEYCVNFDPIFESISYQGVPDIRIIVCCGVPVMSMVRLPTRMSDGKANLHQGALGVGLDLATGTTLTAVLLNDVVTEHPDTANPVTGIKIPNWTDLLTLASRCYDIFHLGYLGVDIVLDKEYGPLLLEVNARPGLNIQIANQAGLLPRLNLVTNRACDLPDVHARVAFAIEHFHT